MSEKVRVGVVGVGEFGRHHVRVYHGLDEAELVGLFDTNQARAGEIAREYGTRVFGSLAELARAVEAASVAVPTREHAQVGRELLEAGVDILVEKPMAASLAEADALLATTEARQRILQVGHTERFNPAVVAAQRILTTPLFFEVHRLGGFSGRSLDVDVVFDIMIHDLDIILSFVGTRPSEVHAVGIPILSPRVDIANVRLEFPTGCVANLTASRVSTEKVRKLRFFQPGQYVSLDLARQDALIISVDAKGRPGAPSATGEPGLKFEQLQAQRGEPLVAELRAFLQAVRSRTPGQVSGLEGRGALEVAERVAQGIAEHARRVPAATFPAGKV
ncbi:MAG: Gfo/Idh/MocA family oxidoreductase [Acidobacteria bacterium]|nr:Gfo/Idh/MocA family oxidoreductase [Acidobacteriota bacterium]